MLTVILGELKPIYHFSFWRNDLSILNIIFPCGFLLFTPPVNYPDSYLR